MIGFLLLYFIWKYFSELAVEFDKNKWVYVLLGIGTYYLGTFIGGFIIGFIAVLMGSDITDSTSTILLSLIAVPFGLLSAWGLHRILKNKWSKNPENNDNGSLDSDLI